MAALAQCCSEIDAATVFFPIPVTGGLESPAPTDFLLPVMPGLGFATRRKIRVFGQLCSGWGFGDGSRLAYHEGLATQQILIPTLVADNLPPSDTPYFPLPGLGLIALEGPEATAFAQAQFANDVVALAPGHWQWSAWLTPKGRVIAVFALLKFSEDRIWLLLPDYPPTTFVEQLQRFVFRRKLKLRQQQDMAISGRFSQPGLARATLFAEHDGGWELDFGSEAMPRSLIIAPAGDTAETDEQAIERWRAYDLEHGFPRLDESQREQWTPQQLSLDRLQAYSVKKGCYPGQEIVARTHFLGKAKRGLALFSASAPVSPGDNVLADGSTLGSFVSAANRDGEYLALAILPAERDTTRALHAGSIPLHEHPLKEGLKRQPS